MKSWFKYLGIGKPQTDSSAIFEVSSTVKGAINAPKMTEAQRDLIVAPSAGIEIYNLDVDRKEFYDGTKWRRVGSGGVAYQESLGFGNGANTAFITTLQPTQEESILVFGNNVRTQTDDYTFIMPNQVVFNTPPPLGVEVYVYYVTEGEAIDVPTPDGIYNVIYHTVTAGDITALGVGLPSIPVLANQVLVDVVHGSTQYYGADYIVSLSFLDWDGLQMENEVAEGDVLRIIYYS